MSEVRKDLLGHRVPVERIRADLDAAGVTHRHLAELLGWRGSKDSGWDLARVRRTLGLEGNYQVDGAPTYSKAVLNKTARRIYAAIEEAQRNPRVPPDISSVPECASLWRCRGCGKWSAAKQRPGYHKRVAVLDRDERSDCMVRCGPFDDYTAMLAMTHPRDVFAVPIEGTEREWYENPNDGIVPF